MTRALRAAGATATAIVGFVLLAPVLVMVAFSFNEPAGRFNFAWQRFSVGSWLAPLDVPGLPAAVASSLLVATVSTVLATALGTAAAYALARQRLRTRSLAGVLLALPLAAPDVVMGAGLLTMLVSIGAARGLPTIVAAHVMLTLTYVAYTVRARVRGADWSLEEAASDLGAGRLRVAATVTLPLLLPGILAGAALAFALSMDDFTVTLFVAGGRVTFPLFVWGAARVATPPQINVVATIILMLAAGVIGLAALAGRRR